jgi:hypothetical protein
MSTTKLSFKDIIQAKNDVINNINYEKQYSYEEYNELVNKNKNEKSNDTCLKLKDKLVLDFIDEHLSTICNTFKDLKDMYNINGFLNNSEYKDIIDILISNVNVDEIISDCDENDQYWEDDEN